MGLAALVLGLAACGDDEEDSDGGSGGDTPAATAPSTETGPVTGGTGAGETLTLAADPEGDLAYDKDSLQAAAGTVTIDFTNQSPVPHDVYIETEGGDVVAETEEISDGQTSAEAELEAGQYTFYCSVANHRDVGMEGTLTVR